MKLPNLLVDVKGRRSTVSAELRGAIATFLTMAYIIPANANILANAVGAPNKHALTACTALAAGVCCILMGVIANFPIALAAGMGLNAMVAFSLSKATGSWQAAMGLVVLDGVVVLLLVLLGAREAVLNAIPRDLRLAIGAGIGLFIALIGLVNCGMVKPHPVTVMTYGELRDPKTGVAMIGLLLTAVLMAWRVVGALIIGIAATTAIAFAFDLTNWPRDWGWPKFSVAFHADLRTALNPKFLPLLFAIVMVDFFDTLGTATAIADEAELHDPSGRIPGVRRLLVVDSISASIGGLFGVSSNTSYIESAAGIAEGARTGLHSVFVGVLFLLAVFLAPLAAVVPQAATAPALVLVGFLMMKQTAAIDFDRLESALPAFITLITIPVTYSIAHGVGYGFIAYVAVNVLRLRLREVHPIMYVVAAAFAAFFLWVKVPG
jgi:AGZA family xanthine/uracil permease-like MFS transporter